MALKIAELGQLVYAPVPMVWENIYQMSNWSHWNLFVKRVELLETPKLDAIGRVFPTSGRPYQFRISRVIPHEIFAFERVFRFGSKLTQAFSLVRNVEGVIITAGFYCEGRWEKQVSLLTRRKLTEQLTQQVSHLKNLSEKTHTREVKIAESKALESKVTYFEKAI